MALAAGAKLGPYEILAPLGAGGMGEVYRARDAKLKRDVALKVLPEAFARDPERMARFQREAEVLASLNHPNIAHIYGVEERALVMELVEGESPKGPMPFDEAWRIASQIESSGYHVAAILLRGKIRLYGKLEGSHQRESCRMPRESVHSGNPGFGLRDSGQHCFRYSALGDSRQLSGITAGGY